MPSLSPTMTEGTISSWRVSPGDEVKQGDTLAEVQTDKASMEMEAMEEGFVAGFPELDLQGVARVDDGVLLEWTVAGR